MQLLLSFNALKGPFCDHNIPFLWHNSVDIDRTTQFWSCAWLTVSYFSMGHYVEISEWRPSVCTYFAKQICKKYVPFKYYVPLYNNWYKRLCFFWRQIWDEAVNHKNRKYRSFFMPIWLDDIKTVDKYDCKDFSWCQIDTKTQ